MLLLIFCGLVIVFFPYINEGGWKLSKKEKIGAALGFLGFICLILNKHFIMAGVLFDFGFLIVWFIATKNELDEETEGEKGESGNKNGESVD
jgi:hypothetical protein